MKNHKDLRTRVNEDAISSSTEYLEIDDAGDGDIAIRFTNTTWQFYTPKTARAIIAAIRKVLRETASERSGHSRIRRKARAH